MESKAINIADLKYLEEELTREELVSVVFLLFGASDRLSLALDNLLLKKNSLNFLQTFAQSAPNWKSIVIEALATVGVYECIEKLGVKSAEAREHLRVKSVINPSIKLLYQLCEACPKGITQNFIPYLTFTNLATEDQLEFYLMRCIVRGTIRLDTNEFTVIKNYFENNEKTEEIEKILEQLPTQPNALDNSSSRIFDTVANPSTSSTSFLGTYKTDKMLVLIINQQTFTFDKDPELKALLPGEPLKDRKGSEKDLEALRKLFKAFNYEVIEKNNLTHKEILRQINAVSKMSLRYDGLIVCLLSHGFEGLFYGSNSIPVQIKDVKELMASRTLLNKPKILLIQACQGPVLQKSITMPMSSLEHDGPVKSGSTRADFLLFWSTVEGFASVRDTEKGTWFIQEFIEKVNDLHGSQHLLDICTVVNNHVSLKRGNKNECMVSKVESTFLKTFKFPSMKSSNS